MDTTDDTVNRAARRWRRGFQVAHWFVAVVLVAWPLGSVIHAQFRSPEQALIFRGESLDPTGRHAADLRRCQLGLDRLLGEAETAQRGTLNPILQRRAARLRQLRREISTLRRQIGHGDRRRFDASSTPSAGPEQHRDR